MDTSAKHLLVELRGCARAPLDDVDALRALLRRAAELAGATVVGEAFHAYSPHGVTGVIVIEESHFSVHTWPEAGYAALDFYTCGKVDPERAARVVAEGLFATQSSFVEVRRGLSAVEGGFAVGRRGSW